jgi:hypothetical protein
MASPSNIILLLGQVRHEGIVSTISTSELTSAHLDLSVEDWSRLFDRVNLANVSAVVGKLGIPELICLGSADHGAQNRELLLSLKQKPNLLFLHGELYSDVLLAKFDEAKRSLRDAFIRYDDRGTQIGDVFLAWGDVPALRRGVSYLKASGLNVVAFRSDPEVTVAAETFIIDTQNGILFRMYVPVGRLYDSEIAHTVELFADYLAKVVRIKVRVDKTLTNCGVIYAFYSDISDANAGAAKFAEFTEFVDLCETSPGAAAELIRHYNLNHRQVAAIIERYAKAAVRLRIETRQQRESALLGIRHRLEIELVEGAGVDIGEVMRLVDSVIPLPRNVGELTTLGAATDPAPGTLQTVNYGTITVGAIHNTIIQEVSGDVVLTTEDEKLLTLFKTHASDDVNILTSALYELKDSSAPVGNRTTARQRIRTFLLNLAGKVEETALGLLKAYIERKIVGL